MITMAEHQRKELEARGNELINEGMAKGMTKALTKLLRTRFGKLPQWAAERLAGASADELDLWTGRIIEAERLEEVFAGGDGGR